MIIKTKRAVTQVRKALRSKVYQKQASLRVYGSKGAWIVGVQVNKTIYPYSNTAKPFKTFKEAVTAASRKFTRRNPEIKVSQYKEKVAA